MKRFSENQSLPIILIVDDVAQNIQVVGNTLRNKLKCELTFATSGSQALDRISKTPPDLILLDVMMPEMDGYEVCDILKADPKTREIPVIFLTAKTETEDIVKGFSAGGADYVTKPFNTDELLARVKTQLALKSQKDLIQQQNNEQKELLHVLCHDLSNPFSSILDGLQLIHDMDSLSEFKPYLLNAVRNGLDVIDLVRKIRKLSDKEEDFRLNSVLLIDLVNESRMMLEAKFEAKKVELVINVEPEVRVVVETVSFVNSVLNNLLTNALKFSNSGSTITVSAAHGDDSKVIIKIVDTGIGMPGNILDNIFNVNKNTTRPGTMGEPGTGFGMPLVKKFIEAYDGDIKVESNEERDYPENHGTTITLTLTSN